MIFKRSTLSLFLLLVAVTPSWAFITYQKSQKQVEEKLAEPVINGKVLGESNTNEQLLFSVNIPAIFKENITAPNIIYSIQAGKGISVTGDQNSTIINTGVTSLQGGTGDLVLTAGTGINLDGLTINNSSNIFKTISVDGQTDVIADSQTDSLTFVGSGVTITTDADNDRITFSAQEPDYSQSGWTDNGSNIVLTNTSDTVTVDSFTAGAITADSLTTSGLALAGGLTVTSGNSILPDTDLGSDLGSASYRFNNLYVGNINSNASVSYSGQTTFSYEPTTTNYLEAAVIINPTNPINNGQLLGIGIAGYQRVLIDEDGDLVLGYSDQISAPTTDYPLNIYGHSGTRVAYIDTSGNETLSGHLALGGATVSGTYALNVNGYIYSNSGVTAVSYPATNSGSAASPIFRWWSDSDTGMFSPGTDTLGFSTAGVEAVRINSSGNVGIKTTNPQYELDIAGNMRTANGYLTIFSSSNIPYLSSINGVNLRLTSGGSVADSNGLTINTGGNVGIGTISPTYKLHVAGNIAASSTISGSGLYTAGSTYTSSIYMYPGLNSDLPIHNSTAGRTVKLSTTQAGGTANTNQLYLDSTGNVGIGTNLPGVKLDVSGAIKFGSAAGTYDILNTTTAGGASSGNLYWGNSTIIDSNNISSFSVVSVANSDNTLTVSPTTGDATVSLNLDNANTWTGLQTFNNTYTDFAQYIRHAGDNDTFLNFTDDSLIIQIGNEPLAFLTENGAQDIVKLGDGGDVDINLNDDLFVEGSSGNVGIGTSSPNSTLNAYYNYGTTDTNLRDVITIDRTTGSAGVAGMGGALLFRNRNYASSQINAGRIGVINTQNVLNNEQPAMVFQTGNNGSITETMRLTYDGKLGIGINTSSAKLAVQGTSTNDLAQFYDSSGNLRSTITSKGYLDLSDTDISGTFNQVLKINNAVVGLSEVSGGLGNGFIRVGPSGRSLANFISDSSVNSLFSGGIENENYRRFFIAGDGTFYTGSGSAATDTLLARNTSGGLKISTTLTSAVNLMLKATSSQTADLFQIQSSGGSTGDKFVVRASGNVGIGQASPGSKLVVVGDNGSGVVSFQTSGGATVSMDNWGNLYVNGGGSIINTGGYITGDVINAYQTNTDFHVTANGTGELILQSNSTGNVGIGTATPAQKLDVVGGIKASALGTGAVYSNSGVLTNTDPSDINLKENILKLSDNTLTKVMGLKPVSYTWKNSGDGALGFIAQDVQQIFPELIGNNGETLGLYTTQFIPILTKAIQEQQAQIDGLTFIDDATTSAQIAELNNKVGIIETTLKKFSDFVNGKLTIAKAYFNELFAEKTHQKELCIGEENNETCLDKTQVDQLLQLIPTETPTPINQENANSESSEASDSASL